MDTLPKQQNKVSEKGPNVRNTLPKAESEFFYFLLYVKADIEQQ